MHASIFVIVAVFAIIDFGVGYSLMTSRKENEVIYRLMKKTNNHIKNAISVLNGTIDGTKLDEELMIKATGNIDLVLYATKLLRCPVMSKIIFAFYNRLYENKRMSDKEMNSMAVQMTMLELTKYKYFKSAPSEDLNKAILTLFNQYDRNFMSYLSGIYEKNKKEESTEVLSH